MSAKGWVGFDLDGTLAEYHGWVPGHIGKPIPKNVERVKRYLEMGVEVKIMTARAFGRGAETSIQQIKAWCKKHIGVELEVTCVKDYGMICLYDDRAVAVEINTGEILGGADEYLV